MISEMWLFFQKSGESKGGTAISSGSMRNALLMYRAFYLQTLQHFIWNLSVNVFILWIGRMRLCGVKWFVQSNYSRSRNPFIKKLQWTCPIPYLHWRFRQKLLLCYSLPPHLLFHLNVLSLATLGHEQMLG